MFTLGNPIILTDAILVAVALFYVRLTWATWKEWSRDPTPKSHDQITETLFKIRKRSTFFTAAILLLMIAMPAIMHSSRNFMNKSSWYVDLILILGIPVCCMLGCGILQVLLERKIRGATEAVGTYLRMVLVGFSTCILAQILFRAVWRQLDKGYELLLNAAVPYEPLFPALTRTVAMSLSTIFLFGVIYFSIYPMLLKLSMPIEEPPEDDELRRLRASLERAGLKSARIWYLNMEGMKAFNAFAWSHPILPFMFRPIVAVSKGLRKHMSSEEINAIVMHEVSHLKLHHVPKRFLTLVGCALLLGVAYLPVHQLLVDSGYFVAAMGAMRSLNIMLAFVVPLVALSRIVRVQELQADSWAVYKLGADPEAMKSSLQKLYELNHMKTDTRDPGSYIQPNAAHPTMQFRAESIEHVRARLANGEPFFQWIDYLKGDLKPRKKAAIMIAATSTEAKKEAS